MSIARIDYYHPHFHREIEICLLIYGNYAVTCEGSTIYAKPGDFWVISPCSVHEYQSMNPGKRAIMLELQMQEDFFDEYFPQIKNCQFPFEIVNSNRMDEKHYRKLLETFMALGNSYFKKEPMYQLETAGLINLFFYYLLAELPCEQVRIEDREQALEKAKRMKELTDYIGEHYGQTLYLSQIADDYGLSMSRLSHVFKESFGMPFQEYLKKIRCEKAGEYLRNTDMQILDISEICGFSDPKYLSQSFRKLYGVRPAEYRRTYRTGKPEKENLPGTENGFPKKEKGFPENGQSLSQNRKRAEEDAEVFCSDEHALAILEYCKL